MFLACTLTVYSVYFASPVSLYCRAAVLTFSHWGRRELSIENHSGIAYIARWVTGGLLALQLGGGGRKTSNVRGECGGVTQEIDFRT